LRAVGITPAFEWLRGSGEFVIGALALPAILRFDPFNFSGSLSLGPSIGYRWRLSPTRDYFGGFVFSVGTSSVQLNSGNTRGRVGTATDRSAYYVAAGDRDRSAWFSGRRLRGAGSHQ
jgi:hypothetical protein